MVESDSGAVDNVCGYCSKNVDTRGSKCVRCKKCDGVYHYSCSQRIKNVKVLDSQNYLIICCDLTTSEVSYRGQDGGKSGDMTPTQTQQQDHFSAVEKLKLENACLLKMLQAAEEKNQLLFENIKLLKENKKLLEEKLDSFLHSDKESRNQGNYQAISKTAPMKYSEIAQQKKLSTNDKYSKQTKQNESVCKQRNASREVLNQNAEPIVANKSSYQELERVQRNKMTDIINLDNDGDNRIEIENDDYKVVKHRGHRRTIIRRVGTNPITEKDKDEGFAGAERRVWLYINRVKPHVTEDIIKKYIGRKPTFKDLKVEVREVKYADAKGDLKSFMVKAPLEKKDELYQPDFWPEGVGIKRFNFKLYNKNQTSSDFL